MRNTKRKRENLCRQGEGESRIETIRYKVERQTKGGEVSAEIDVKHHETPRVQRKAANSNLAAALATESPPFVKSRKGAGWTPPPSKANKKVNSLPVRHAKRGASDSSRIFVGGTGTYPTRRGGELVQKPLLEKEARRSKSLNHGRQRASAGIGGGDADRDRFAIIKRHLTLTDLKGRTARGDKTNASCYYPEKSAGTALGHSGPGMEGAARGDWGTV